MTELFDYLDMGLEIMQLVAHRQTTIVDQKMSGKSRTNMFGDWLWGTTMWGSKHLQAQVVMEQSVAGHPVDKGRLWGSSVGD